jgi:hypothetical protein
VPGTEDLREVYRGFGTDLAVCNGDPSWHLLVLARIVIDAQGIVRSVEADPDYGFGQKRKRWLDRT